MAFVSHAAPSGQGVDESAAEVALVGGDSGEQVVESVSEALRSLRDSRRRFEARSLIVAGSQKLREAGDYGQGRLHFVCERRERLIAVTRLSVGSRAQSSPRLCASETASARRRTPSFAKIRDSSVFTVSSPMESSTAMSRLVDPAATRRSTSRSLGLSAARPGARFGCRAS
jgi:hypothetical protein